MSHRVIHKSLKIRFISVKIHERYVQCNIVKYVLKNIKMCISNLSVKKLKYAISPNYALISAQAISHTKSIIRDEHCFSNSKQCK